MQANSKTAKNHATLFTRACAGGVDLSVLIITWFAFHSWYMSAPDSNMMVIYIVDRVFPVVLIIYFTFCEWYWGKTPGKWLFNIEVTTKQGIHLDFKVAALRNVLKFFSIFILFAGYIIALFRKDNLTFHDVLSECIVIKIKK